MPPSSLVVAPANFTLVALQYVVKNGAILVPSKKLNDSTKTRFSILHDSKKYAFNFEMMPSSSEFY
jgi:hypothetical protein